jgi:hypothetical protein
MRRAHRTCRSAPRPRVRSSDCPSHCLAQPAEGRDNATGGQRERILKISCLHTRLMVAVSGCKEKFLPLFSRQGFRFANCFHQAISTGLAWSQLPNFITCDFSVQNNYVFTRAIVILAGGHVGRKGLAFIESRNLDNNTLLCQSNARSRCPEILAFCDKEHRFTTACEASLPSIALRVPCSRRLAYRNMNSLIALVFYSRDGRRRAGRIDVSINRKACSTWTARLPLCHVQNWGFATLNPRNQRWTEPSRSCIQFDLFHRTEWLSLSRAGGGTSARQEEIGSCSRLVVRSA